jgi:hypothetical protein
MKLWTTKEELYLTELYQRFSIKACAYILKRTESSVDSRVFKLGLTTERKLGNDSKTYAEDVANIFELITMGFTHKEISKCFKCMPTTVTKIVERAKREGFDSYPKREQQ